MIKKYQRLNFLVLKFFGFDTMTIKLEILITFVDQSKDVIIEFDHFSSD